MDLVLRSAGIPDRGGMPVDVGIAGGRIADDRCRAAMPPADDAGERHLVHCYHHREALRGRRRGGQGAPAALGLPYARADRR